MDSTYYNPGIQILTCDFREVGRWWTRYRFVAPYWRLYWNPRPGATLVFGEKRMPLEPARFVLIPPETDFHAQCPAATPHLYIHFLAHAPFDAVMPGLYSFRAGSTLLRQAQRLQSLVMGRRSMREQSLAALAMVHVAICHIPESAIRPAPEDLRIVRVLAAMDQNPQMPLSNPQLAELAAMSTNAFIRLFQRVTGQSPQAYYTRKRIERTCMQLHFGDLGIDQIAEQAGFCDRYHFTRTFKRLRGIGPGAFRRQRGRVAQ